MISAWEYKKQYFFLSQNTFSPLFISTYRVVNKKKWGKVVISGKSDVNLSRNYYQT
jgi:hypothetical protein